MPFHFKTTQDDFVARLTEAAYGVLLRQGLRNAFVEVELELWREIGEAAQDELVPAQSRSRGAPIPRGVRRRGIDSNSIVNTRGNHA